MFRIARACSFVALISVAASAMPQGSAGAYGQGGGGGLGGGGFGGGSAGGQFGLSRNRFSGGNGLNGQAPGQGYVPRDRNAKPEEESTPGLWQTRSAILTPGDRVEYKFKLAKNETILAGATSDAFDAALAVTDAKGAELIKNDDREEGDQSPFVIWRAREAGNYILKVLSYRPVSGGKFTVKFRTFQTYDATVDNASHTNDVELSRLENNESRVVFRLSAHKGHIYDLRNPADVSHEYPYPEQLVRVVGPTGVDKNDFEPVPTVDESNVLEALADGDYYLEYAGQPTKKVRTDFREVSMLKMGSKGDQPIDLAGGELKIIDFPVTPNLIVRTTFSAPSAHYLLTAPNDPKDNHNSGSDAGFGSDPSMTWFNMDVNSSDDFVRVFHGTGNARIAIRSTKSEAQKVTIKNSESLPAWDSGKDIKDELGIGKSRLYLVNSKTSELMRVNAATKQFQLKLDIFRLAGEQANSLMDPKTQSVHDDLYFPEANAFIVRVSCEGFGGSGDFTILRQPPKTTAYTLGQTETMKLDGSNFFLYTVNLEAGKRYELITDLPQQADLLEDDGTFLRSPAVYFDKTEVQYFTPKKSGPHRLWLRGEPALVHFKLQPNVPPSVGK